MVPLPNKCCFYCQLQTGGVILGWLGIISAAFSIAFALVSFAFLPEIAELLTEEKVQDVPPVLGSFICVILVMFVLFNLITLGSSICLVIGTVKNKHLLVLPWLVSEMGSIIIFTLFFLFDFFSIFTDNGVAIEEKLFSFVLSLIFLAFDCYLWMCVFSLYHKIKQDNIVNNESEMVTNEVNDGLPPYKNLA